MPEETDFNTDRDSDEDDMFDEFLRQRGHSTEGWQEEYQKVSCPECGAVHDSPKKECDCCGWHSPTQE